MIFCHISRTHQDQPPADSSQLFFNLLPSELQVGVHHLVSSLHSLLQMVDATEDIFTVGPFSRLVGEQLEAWQPARARRKAVASDPSRKKKVSLVLLDRTLDLATPTASKSDTLLGRLRASLPTLPGQPSDSAVEISPLFGMEAKDQLPPGCLCSSFHLRKKDEKDGCLEDLLGSDSDTLVSTYYNRLSKFKGEKEKKNATVEDLEALLLKFTNEEEAIAANLDDLMRSRAVILSRSNQVTKREGKMAEVEERFLKAWAKSNKEGRGFLVQLSKLVRERRERGLDLDDLVLLTTHCYSLISPDEEFYPEDEDRLQSALSEALVSDKARLPAAVAAMAQEEGEMDELVAFRTVKRLFQRLNSIRTARASLKGPHRSLLDSKKGLLHLLLSDMFAEDRRDVPDLEHRAGGLGGLLKSAGMGLFGMSVGPRAPHPRENPALWLFVVGGISADEAAVARAVIRERSAECQLLVGGTGLTSPAQTLDSLFVQDVLLSSKM